MGAVPHCDGFGECAHRALGRVVSWMVVWAAYAGVVDGDVGDNDMSALRSEQSGLFGDIPWAPPLIIATLPFSHVPIPAWYLG